MRCENWVWEGKGDARLAAHDFAPIPAAHLQRLCQNVGVVIALDLFELLHDALHCWISVIPICAHTAERGQGWGVSTGEGGYR
jgi:hypothetical protein